MKKFILTFIAIFSLASNVFAIKIGYINTDNLLQNSTQFKQIQANIATEFEKKDAKLKQRADKIKKLIANFKEIRGDLTKGEIKEQVETIGNLDRGLQKDAIKLKKQFSLRGQEELQNIQNTLNAIIEKFAKTNKFDLILYREVAFVNDKIDITKQIAKKLATKLNK